MNTETEIRVTQVTVLPKGDPIFSEMAHTLTIEDEAAGEFVVVRSLADDGGKVYISPGEWLGLRHAIDDMVKDCRPAPEGGSGKGKASVHNSSPLTSNERDQAPNIDDHRQLDRLTDADIRRQIAQLHDELHRRAVKRMDLDAPRFCIDPAAEK